MRQSVTCILTIECAAALTAGGLPREARAAETGCDITCRGDFIDPEACSEELNNVGCGGIPFFFDIAPGQIACGNAWAIDGLRDTEWFVLDLDAENGDRGGTAQICATLISEFDGVCFIVDGVAQCAPVIVGEGAADCGQNLQVATACVNVPGTYFIFVATSTFDGVDCDGLNDYQLCVDVQPTCGSECPPCTRPGPCVWDLNDDDSVGPADLAALLDAWGPCLPSPAGRGGGGEGACPADFNGNGVVGPEDLAALLDAWGPCP